MKHIQPKIFSVVIGLIVAFMHTNIVSAARPSITNLQQQINVLNARMNTLETELETVRPVYVKSNSENIGVLIISTDDSQEPELHYKVYSSKGYLFTVYDHTGLLRDLVLRFTSYDCTAPAYHVVQAIPFGSSPPFTRSTGIVYAAPPNSLVKAYYEETGVATVMITSNSLLKRDGTCVQENLVQVPAYPLLPNDPAVTGVQNSYSLPITTGF